MCNNNLSALKPGDMIEFTSIRSVLSFEDMNNHFVRRIYPFDPPEQLIVLSVGKKYDNLILFTFLTKSGIVQSMLRTDKFEFNFSFQTQS
jgi:hypothetical protein